MDVMCKFRWLVYSLIDDVKFLYQFIFIWNLFSILKIKFEHFKKLKISLKSLWKINNKNYKFSVYFLPQRSQKKVP